MAPIGERERRPEAELWDAFEPARPKVLGRPDLADRAIFLTMPPISDKERRPEVDLWCAFDRAQPAILGALLDVAAHGLKTRSHVRGAALPRMADFALWATVQTTAIDPATGMVNLTTMLAHSSGEPFILNN